MKENDIFDDIDDVIGDEYDDDDEDNIKISDSRKDGEYVYAKWHHLFI